MATKALQNYMVISDELYLERSGGVLPRSLYMVEAREELQRIHDFSCWDNISVFVGACKDGGIIGLRWPGRLLIYRKGVRGLPGTPLCKGTFICSGGGQRLDTTLHLFPSTLFMPKIHSDTIIIKRNLQDSLSKNIFFQKRPKSSTSQMYSKRPGNQCS